MSMTIDEVMIPPSAVSLNPSYESDWLRALYRFVTEASKSGQTVKVSVEEKTFTPAETGQLLGLSRSTIQRQIASGHVRATKVGSRYRVSEGEIRRLRRVVRDEVAEMFANDF